MEAVRELADFCLNHFDKWQRLHSFVSCIIYYFGFNNIVNEATGCPILCEVETVINCCFIYYAVYGMNISDGIVKVLLIVSSIFYVAQVFIIVFRVSRLPYSDNPPNQYFTLQPVAVMFFLQIYMLIPMSCSIVHYISHNQPRRQPDAARNQQATSIEGAEQKND